MDFWYVGLVIALVALSWALIWLCGGLESE
jgi:hypothetical protein